MTELYPKATSHIPWPRIAEEIERLGGLWKLTGGDRKRYARLYYALTINCNPTLETVKEILQMTGLTFEEAFSV